MGKTVHRGNLSPSSAQCVDPSTIQGAPVGATDLKTYETTTTTLSVVATRRDALRVMGIDARVDARYLSLAGGSASFSLLERAESSGDSLTAIFQARIDYPDETLTETWKLAPRAKSLLDARRFTDFTTLCGTHLVNQVSRSVVMVYAMHVSSLSSSSLRVVHAALSGSYNDPTGVSAHLESAFYDEISSRSEGSDLQVEIYVNGNKASNELASRLLADSQMAPAPGESLKATGQRRADAVRVALANHVSGNVNRNSAFPSAFWLAPWAGVFPEIGSVSGALQDQSLQELQTLYWRAQRTSKNLAEILARRDPRHSLYAKNRMPVQEAVTKWREFGIAIARQHGKCKADPDGCADIPSLESMSEDLTKLVPTFPEEPRVAFELLIDGHAASPEQRNVVLSSMDARPLLDRVRAIAPNAQAAELFGLILPGKVDDKWTSPYTLVSVHPFLFGDRILGTAPALPFENGGFRVLLECAPCAGGREPINPRLRLEQHARTHPYETAPNGYQTILGGNVRLLVTDSTGLVYDWSIAGVHWLSAPRPSRVVNHTGYNLPPAASFDPSKGPSVRRCGAGNLPGCK